MDKLTASCKAIKICAALIEKLTHTATSNYNTKPLIKAVILDAIWQLEEVIKELDKI